MLSKAQLVNLQNTNINDAGLGTLPNLLDVSIHGNTPVQKLESFLSQVDNPYCFKVDNTPVRVSFIDGGKPLEELLKTYFLGLKR